MNFSYCLDLACLSYHTMSCHVMPQFTFLFFKYQSTGRVNQVKHTTWNMSFYAVCSLVILLSCLEFHFSYFVLFVLKFSTHIVFFRHVYLPWMFGWTNGTKLNAVGLGPWQSVGKKLNIPSWQRQEYTSHFIQFFLIFFKERRNALTTDKDRKGK